MNNRITTVIYFNDPSKNKYADFKPDREHAKRFAKRVYINAMQDIVTEKAKVKSLMIALAQ